LFEQFRIDGLDDQRQGQAQNGVLVLDGLWAHKLRRQSHGEATHGNHDFPFRQLIEQVVDGYGDGILGNGCGFVQRQVVGRQQIKQRPQRQTDGVFVLVEQGFDVVKRLDGFKKVFRAGFAVRFFLVHVELLLVFAKQVATAIYRHR